MVADQYDLKKLRKDLKKRLPKYYKKFENNDTRITVDKFKFTEHKELIKHIMRKMKQLINYGLENDPLIRTAALLILNHTKPLTEQKDIRELKAIIKFVKKNFMYVRDVHSKETLHEPQVILIKNASIDCDDFSILLATLYKSIGYKVRLKAVQMPGRPMLHHVYIKVYSPQKKKWFAIDGIMKNKGEFYEPPHEDKLLLEV